MDFLALHLASELNELGPCKAIGGVEMAFRGGTGERHNRRILPAWRRSALGAKAGRGVEKYVLLFCTSHVHACSNLAWLISGLVV